MPSGDGEESEELRVEGTKFDLGGLIPSIGAGELPWSYGEDRMTSIVRDPESAYLYWEITDEGIAAARSRLGPSGARGWCNLRVYDTTGRTFDGTNAVDYFDICVERGDREYFLMIRRPTSTMHVEIGIKTDEGYFQPIARSGRADFPRNSPSPNTSLEWITVTPEDTHPAAAPYRSRYAGPPPRLPGREGAGYLDVWRAAYAPSKQLSDGAPEHPLSSGATVHRMFERAAHVERWWHLDEWRAEWRGGLRFTRWAGPWGEEGGTTWHEGPFPAEMVNPERVLVEFFGDPPTRRWRHGAGFTVFGPWRVTVRSFESEPQRRILATWMIRCVWAATPVIERWGRVLERRAIAAYEREHVVLGASERHRLLERGASEVWRLGASERMWLGGSEWWIGGASETLAIAGSLWAYAGASALLQWGSSERFGSSERMGASQRWRELGGASEWIGASVMGTGSGQGFAENERWGGRLGEG
jgi:hypothetical protein